MSIAWKVRISKFALVRYLVFSPCECPFAPTRKRSLAISRQLLGRVHLSADYRQNINAPRRILPASSPAFQRCAAEISRHAQAAIQRLDPPASFEDYLNGWAASSLSLGI